MPMKTAMNRPTMGVVPVRVLDQHILPGGDRLISRKATHQHDGKEHQVVEHQCERLRNTFSAMT